MELLKNDLGIWSEVNQYTFVPKYKQYLKTNGEENQNECMFVRILSCKKFSDFLFCHDVVLRHKLEGMKCINFKARGKIDVLQRGLQCYKPHVQ